MGALPVGADSSATRGRRHRRRLRGFRARSPMRMGSYRERQPTRVERGRRAMLHGPGGPRDAALLLRRAIASNGPVAGWSRDGGARAGNKVATHARGAGLRVAVAALGHGGRAAGGARPGPGLSPAAATGGPGRRHRRDRGRRHPPARVRRRRGRVAVSGFGRHRVAAVRAGVDRLRRPLVRLPPRRQSVRPGARRRPVAAQRRDRVGRLDPDHAGRAHPGRARHPQRRRQAAADGARTAARSTPVESADPAAVPGARTVRRHHRRRRGRQLGLPGQARRAALACRGRAAGGAAAGAQPPATGPASAGGAAGARQGAGADAGAGPLDRRRGRRRADRAGGRALAAATGARRAAGAAPAPGAPACAADRHHARRPAAARPGRARLRLLRRAAAADLGRAAGGGQRHHAGARLRRLGRVRRPRTAGACRHGPRVALAGLDAQAVPLWHGAGRRPGPFRQPAGGCAAGFRRLPAGQLRRSLQRSGERGRRAAAVAERAGGGPARPGRTGALRRAARPRRDLAALPARRAAEPGPDPRWHRRAPGGPGRRLRRLPAPGRGGAGALHARRAAGRTAAAVAGRGLDRARHPAVQSAARPGRGRVRYRLAPGGGLEDRHQLRLPRCLGGGWHAPLHGRGVDRAPGRHAAAGPVRRAHRAAVAAGDHRWPAARAGRCRSAAATGDGRAGGRVLAAGPGGRRHARAAVPSPARCLAAGRQRAADLRRARCAPVACRARAVPGRCRQRLAAVGRLRAHPCRA